MNGPFLSVSPSSDMLSLLSQLEPLELATLSLSAFFGEVQGHHYIHLNLISVQCVKTYFMPIKFWHWNNHQYNLSKT